MPDRSINEPLLRRTYHGLVATTMDALILFEASLTGDLRHVSRRPYDRERAAVIISGNVFIYDEHSSLVQRWTDGLSWSPSRVLGNFLVYRELDKPFPAGEKKRAIKRSRLDGSVSRAITDEFGSDSADYTESSGMRPSNGQSGGFNNSTGSPTDTPVTDPRLQLLIGSLVDSYAFKKDGLVKKAIRVSYQGVNHHLVSYYSIESALSGHLIHPTEHGDLVNVVPRQELIHSGNLRDPVESLEIYAKTEDIPIYMTPCACTSQSTYFPLGGSDDVGFMPMPSISPYLQTWAGNSWSPALANTAISSETTASSGIVLPAPSCESSSSSAKLYSRYTQPQNHRTPQAHNVYSLTTSHNEPFGGLYRSHSVVPDTDDSITAGGNFAFPDMGVLEPSHIDPPLAMAGTSNSPSRGVSLVSLSPSYHGSHYVAYGLTRTSQRLNGYFLANPQASQDNS